MDKESGIVKAQGLGLVIASVFLAGEMAGGGVLALAKAMVFTGPAGLAFIIFFAVNTAFVGTRLGLCWVMMEERYPEMRDQVRDPYPTIAQKATGAIGRHLATICITITLYGDGCVYIVAMATYLKNIFMELEVEVSLCYWMLIVAVVMAPICWLGTPNDFWPVAVGALITTVVASVLVMVRESLDAHDESSCYYIVNSETGEPEFDHDWPAPTVEGFFQAFSTVMFAYSGASTFPTIQADMKDRRKFPLAAMAAMSILLCIYFSMAAVGYYQLGDFAAANIVESVCNGGFKIAIEVILLLHFVAAFPIMTNPPNQFFEEALGIPKTFNWKRCAFRTSVVFFLLFIAECLPNFGSLLDLIGGSTVTLLTFVFPPFFYMRLVDSSQENKEWKNRSISKLERGYCWFVIIFGVVGGSCATYNAVKNIVENNFTLPCFLEEPVQEL